MIEGLPADDARLLLDATIPGPLDEQVKARILDETRGNPLALMELPRGLTPAELAGGFGLPDARPLTSRIEQSFLQRVETLPRDTQLLLLTAAAEPLGDVSLLWRAAERLGIGTEAGWPAEAAGLIELGARVRFPHPLVRSAVYRASDPSDRRDVRRALADSTDPVLDPDRRAWHRAHATTTPDEAVAAEMARSADRARGRGGLAAAAAFLQRAAELTPDPAVRVERSLAAAQAKLDVADAASASALLAAAELGPLDDLQRGRLERLRAEIAFTSRRGRDAPLLLLEAARRLDPLDGALARETYLEAIASAMFAGRLGTGPDEREVAEAARASHPVRGRGRGRSAPRRPRDAVHRGLCAVGRAALACAARVRRSRRQRRRRALAVAGVPPRTGSLGRRALARARDARRARRTRHRRARPARERAQLRRRLQRPFRGLRHCRGADRRGRRDHASDRAPAAQVRGVQAGRVARRSGADAGVPRPLVEECGGARRRLGVRPVLGSRRAAAQRLRPVRQGARGRAAGVRARGRHGVRLGARRAGRGRRPRRTAGRGRRRARPSERTHAGERHRMGARGGGALVVRC